MRGQQFQLVFSRIKIFVKFFYTILGIWQYYPLTILLFSLQLERSFGAWTSQVSFETPKDSSLTQSDKYALNS